MNTADMLIYMHPDLDMQKRLDLERNLMGQIGVDCAEFQHKPNPHALIVKYDPDVIESMDLLQLARKVDPQAVMAGL